MPPKKTSSKKGEKGGGEGEDKMKKTKTQKWRQRNKMPKSPCGLCILGDEVTLSPIIE